MGKCFTVNQKVGSGLNVADFYQVLLGVVTVLVVKIDRLRLSVNEKNEMQRPQ